MKTPRQVVRILTRSGNGEGAGAKKVVRCYRSMIDLVFATWLRPSAETASRIENRWEGERMKKVNARKLLESLGLNQAEFWGRIEVTQSGGSRYENGRAMPGPVRKLFGIVYLSEKP